MKYKEKRKRIDKSSEAAKQGNRAPSIRPPWRV